MLLGLVEGVRDIGLAALCFPLRHAGRALRQLPFVFEQVLEEVVAPLRRRLRPRDFRTARDGVAAMARAVLALPAKALVLECAGFRLRTDQRRIAGAVGFSERVAARDQREGLFLG